MCSESTSNLIRRVIQYLTDCDCFLCGIFIERIANGTECQAHAGQQVVPWRHGINGISIVIISVFNHFTVIVPLLCLLLFVCNDIN